MTYFKCSAINPNEITITINGTKIDHSVSLKKTDVVNDIELSTLPYEFNKGSAVVLDNEIHILGSEDSSSNYTKHYMIQATHYVIV